MTVVAGVTFAAVGLRDCRPKRLPTGTIRSAVQRVSNPIATFDSDKSPASMAAKSVRKLSTNRTTKVNATNAKYSTLFRTVSAHNTITPVAGQYNEMPESW